MTFAAQADEPAGFTSVEVLSKHYTHFILDIFGVIHDGIRPFPGTIRTLKHLKDRGIQTCLLSNSPKRAQGAIDQMTAMGIARDLYGDVVTSGEATFTALSQPRDAFHQSCGHDCWFIGTPAMMSCIDGLNLNLVDGPQNASFILNAIPGTQPSAVEKLKQQLQAAAAKNLPMICANPDLVVNIGDDQYECAGTFAKIYEDLGGRVLYHGKPHKPVYELCHALLDKPQKSAMIAIGDSLHTDIAGANRFGIDCALNLDGIHKEEVCSDHPGAQEAALGRLLASQPHQPNHILSRFVWSILT